MFHRLRKNEQMNSQWHPATHRQVTPLRAQILIICGRQSGLSSLSNKRLAKAFGIMESDMGASIEELIQQGYMLQCCSDLGTRYSLTQAGKCAVEKLNQEKPEFIRMTLMQWSSSIH